MTFHLWPKVLLGEEKWINPFKEKAEVSFDSSLDYELAVLKPYVEGLIAKVLLSDKENIRSQVLSEMFSLIHTSSANAVPGDSILRETIGGSQLEY